MVDITEIPWIYHCMFVWHCIVHIATYIFCLPYFSPFQQPRPRASSHQVQLVMKPRERLGLRMLEDHWYVCNVYIDIHIHTCTHIYVHTIYTCILRVSQNQPKQNFQWYLQGHVAFETQIFITDEHIQTTYIKIHIWSCAHNCLFTYMQSTPASTESFVCRVIGSLKFVPLRCLTNRATGKSASNQATMVQHVNTAQNGHDLQQLPKHSFFCDSETGLSYIYITFIFDSRHSHCRFILDSK